MKNLEITLVKSLIATKPKQRKTAKALGLNKINQTVVKQDTETIRGMINIISHLVNVVEK
ncbi:MAG: 50S ribosomal protein L30 [Candidatus Izemoplasmataceae bacterium]|jgi:large subunit ribosomal protein L30|uniref:50S ribosomal protein L30 n=1 Tax=Liberiplasma polymorphum TaxID=3374570 RepID=UPI0037746030